MNAKQIISSTMAIAVIFSACVLDEPPHGEALPQDAPVPAVHRSTRIVSNRAEQWAVREINTIRRDVMARLTERGHTMDDLRRAAEAEDVSEVRALLGMTQAQYDAYDDRVQKAAGLLLRRPHAEGPDAAEFYPPWTRGGPEAIEEDADCEYVFLSICALGAAKLAKSGGIVGWILAIAAMRECLCKYCWGITSIC